MRSDTTVVRIACAVLALGSILLPRPALAIDIVASDDVVKGSSVFVFRNSKRPQERMGGGPSAGGASAAARSKINSQLALARQKRTAMLRQRQAELARARARNARIRLSNTLTARAGTQLAAGQIELAVANYREAIRSNPSNAAAKIGLSEALTVKGIEAAGERLDEAGIVFLNEAIKLDPNNEAALAKLAEIHFEKGRYRESAAFYERAVAADPGFTSLFVPLSIAYREIGEEEKAESMLRRAEAAGMDMGDERIGSAMRLHRAGKNAEAIAYLEKLATADPGDSEIPYHIGLIFDRAGQPDKAIESYRRAVRIQPLSPHSWFNIGAIHYNRGEYLKAIEAYTETIRIDPNNAVAYANLAGAYRQLERYVEANIQYRKAEEKGMKTPDLYSEWGFCLGKVEEWEKASQRLETARAMSPSPIDDTNAGWAFYNRAQAHKRDGRQAEWAADLETARVLFRSAVEKDPTLEAAFLNLGSTLNALGLHGDAMAALTAALRLRSEWTIAMNQLGLAHRGRNELALAIKQFDRVVALEPRNAAGLFNLGSAQNAGGDKKAARKTQERLKAVDPALADRLGNVIAGKVLEEGTREIRKRIRIPGL